MLSPSSSSFRWKTSYTTAPTPSHQYDSPDSASPYLHIFFLWWETLRTDSWRRHWGRQMDRKWPASFQTKVGIKDDLLPSRFMYCIQRCCHFLRLKSVGRTRWLKKQSFRKCMERSSSGLIEVESSQERLKNTMKNISQLSDIPVKIRTNISRKHFNLLTVRPRNRVRSLEMTCCYRHTDELQSFLLNCPPQLQMNDVYERDKQTGPSGSVGSSWSHD